MSWGALLMSRGLAIRIPGVRGNSAHVLTLFLCRMDDLDGLSFS